MLIENNDNEGLWKLATSTHPFLRACADESITETAFARWLVQVVFSSFSFLMMARAGSILIILISHVLFYLMIDDDNSKNNLLLHLKGLQVRESFIFVC